MVNTDFEKIRTYLAPHAMRLTKNKLDAEDLIQDTMLKAFKAIDKYDGVRCLNNWVHKIMVRTWLDTVRNRGRKVTTVSLNNPLQGDYEGDIFVDFPDDVNIENDVVAKSVAEELMRFLLINFKSNAAPFIMSEMQDIPYEEIAQKLNLKTGTVRSRIHRCRKQALAVIQANPSLRERFGVLA